MVLEKAAVLRHVGCIVLIGGGLSGLFLVTELIGQEAKVQILPKILLMASTYRGQTGGVLELGPPLQTEVTLKQEATGILGKYEKT